MKKSNRISGVLRACLTGPAFLLMLGVACFWSTAASALTQTLSPATCASVAWPGGTRSWSNPTRAISSNNSYATASVDGTTTRYLQCTGYNFTIPVGSTINGITVSVERRSSSVANGGSRDAATRLIKAGVVGTTDRSSATLYTTADIIAAHGGAADLWGTTWLATDINAANFGAAFAATKASAAGASHTVSADHVQITVDYSPPPGTYSVTASPASCASVAGIGTVGWTNPTRAISSNNSYASASVDGTTTRYLQCTGYNFAIPAGATINGITVNVERRSSRTTDGGSRDAAMRLLKAGVVGATDRSTATPYTTGDIIEAHGGVADLWGATWLPADINAANFGSAFAATKASAVGASHTVSVDHVPITVTYTIGAPGPHHINLTHAGSALTCSPQIVTITACANAACTAPHYSGGTNVTLMPGALTFAIDATGINSVATVQQSMIGVATLAATSVPAASNAATCWNTATSTASCSMTFNDSGFVVTVPNHTSCANATATIEAVQTAPGTGRCVPAYQNVTRAVNLNFAYANPLTGTQIITVVSGSSLSSIGTATASHNLAFNNVGTATLVLSYPDVGQLTINASGTAPTGAALSGSGTFVTAPATFAFSGIPVAPLTAGQPFNATVTAMNACATPAATRNFNGTVTLTSSNPLPGIGNATAINATLSGFSNGVASTNLSWGEVGLIDLNASMSSYLGWTLPVAASGSQTGVGRFHPAYFDTIVTPACGVLPNLFTYAGSTAPAKAGQPFSVTVKAKRFGGDLTDATNTRNYAGAYAYATTLSNAGVTTGFANNTIAAAAFANGVGSASTVTYAVATPQTAPLTLALRATDSDTPAVSSFGHTEGATETRSGRVRLFNAHGSERLDLPVTMQAQYWSGAGWVFNQADTCTGDATLGVANAASVTVTPATAPAIATCVQDSGNPGLSGAGCAAAGPVVRRYKEGATPGIGFAGDFNLWLKAPAATGAVTVTGIVPVWLQYDWSGAGAVNPAARATFGVFKGANEFIYMREQY